MKPVAVFRKSSATPIPSPQRISDYSKNGSNAELNGGVRIRSLSDSILGNLSFQNNDRKNRYLFAFSCNLSISPISFNKEMNNADEFSVKSEMYILVLW